MGVSLPTCQDRQCEAECDHDGAQLTFLDRLSCTRLHLILRYFESRTLSHRHYM